MNGMTEVSADDVDFVRRQVRSSVRDETLAVEVCRFGITANCIAPGFIAGDMTKATAERIGVDWEQYVADRAKAIPVQRAGEVDDIANAVSFFADPRSGFVSGQVLYVAGGPRT